MADHPIMLLTGKQQIEKVNDLDVFVFNDGERPWLIVSAEGAMMGQRTVIDPLVTGPIIVTDQARIKPGDPDSISKSLKTKS